VIPPTPGCTLLVTRCPGNTASPFWASYTNGRATLVAMDPDGLWDVMMHDGNPVVGVKPERFLVLAPAPARKRWWQFWRRA
jgi:hypothetical protein